MSVAEMRARADDRDRDGQPVLSRDHVLAPESVARANQQITNPDAPSE